MNNFWELGTSINSTTIGANRSIHLKMVATASSNNVVLYAAIEAYNYIQVISSGNVIIADSTQTEYNSITSATTGWIPCVTAKWTDTTYSLVSSSVNGLAPKVINTNTTAIDTGYYLLASTNGSSTPSWYKLPASAFYYRPISINGVSILGNNNTALNLKSGTNISISNSGADVTISSPGVTTLNQAIPYIKGPDTDTVAGTWTGSYSGITEYTEGLTIIYVPKVAGASTTTLNLNGLGAKTCYYTGTAKLTTHYAVGTPILFTYSGGAWKRADFYTDSNTYTSAWCGTAAATAAKTATCTNYTLKANSYVHILIRYANTVAGAITLNINSTGAKPIYINGAASSASNYTLPAGTYIVYYDGTNFYFRTDGILPGTI